MPSAKKFDFFKEKERNRERKSRGTHLKKVLNILVMPCWFGSAPFSVVVGKLVFEADVLVESARGVVLVVVGVDSDWSLDLEYCLYQRQYHFYPHFLVV